MYSSPKAALRAYDRTVIALLDRVPPPMFSTPIDCLRLLIEDGTLDNLLDP